MIIHALRKLKFKPTNVCVLKENLIRSVQIKAVSALVF